MENVLYGAPVLQAQYFDRTIHDYYNFCHLLKKAASSLSNSAVPVLLCIGTDRMTGDCLGPLVGHKLAAGRRNPPNIYGTLKHPVHALNLSYVLTQIRLHYENPFIVVIDAALGLPGHVGKITLCSGPLRPGEGMKKQLPAVGDLSITGIVNSCYGNTCLLLQNTRLHLVNELADFIGTGLQSCFSF